MKKVQAKVITVHVDTTKTNKDLAHIVKTTLGLNSVEVRQVQVQRIEAPTPAKGTKRHG